jgi:DNA-binding NtrC family response regulator
VARNTILLIDDDAAILRSVGEYFEKQGFEVHRAASGKEGVATWERVDPEVTVLDLHMPEMDGMQVLKVLRRQHATVIILTGYGEIDIAVEAMKLGAENFLTKPIDMSHLSAIVQKAAEKAALKQENKELRARLTPSVKRRLMQVGLLVLLLAASAVIGLFIGGGGRVEDRPRNPIPVPVDTTPP